MTDPHPPEDGGLFDLPAQDTGRHERAFIEAFTAGESARMLEPIDRALMSVALAGAAALDRAEAIGSPGKSVYPVAQLIGPTREVLESLRLSPSVRASAVDDAIEGVLRDLATPADGPAQVPHDLDR
ncbi:hypothetical protein [Dietzia sp. 179-F 9C3 NHS]|uniref:hypothetical protein n=1 Tax=Dietzia sp. 179-F 9C3 NHS TaxID=3374295 RepID=UPI00387A30FB